MGRLSDALWMNNGVKVNRREVAECDRLGLAEAAKEARGALAQSRRDRRDAVAGTGRAVEHPRHDRRRSR
jgi:hypothetical protein